MSHYFSWNVIPLLINHERLSWGSLTCIHSSAGLLPFKCCLTLSWRRPLSKVLMTSKTLKVMTSKTLKVLMTSKTLTSQNMLWPWLWQKVKQVKVTQLIHFIFNVQILHFCSKKVLQRVSNKHNIQHNEISKSYICRANQWTGFHMITAPVMKELISKTLLHRVSVSKEVVGRHNLSTCNLLGIRQTKRVTLLNICCKWTLLLNQVH